jgi:hypothetical protein
MKQKLFHLLGFLLHSDMKRILQRKIKTYNLLQRKTVSLWIYFLFVKNPNTKEPHK